MVEVNAEFITSAFVKCRGYNLGICAVPVDKNNAEVITSALNQHRTTRDGVWMSHSRWGMDESQLAMG